MGKDIDVAGRGRRRDIEKETAGPMASFIGDQVRSSFRTMARGYTTVDEEGGRYQDPKTFTTRHTICDKVV